MRKGEKASTKTRKRMSKAALKRLADPVFWQKNTEHLRRLSVDPEIQRKRAATVAKKPPRKYSKKERARRAEITRANNIARGDPARRRAKQIGGHCTYTLCTPSGEPFYVGAGDFDRPYHAKSRMGPPGEICRAILTSGRVLLKIIIETEDIAEAHEIEQRLIALHGRQDIGTGCLVNKSAGGMGSRGMIVSQNLRDKRSKRFKGKKRSAADCRKMREGWNRRKERLACS